MRYRDLIGATALAAALAIPLAAAAQDASQYPDWSGQWMRKQGDPAGSYDPAKPNGRGQQAPLTPEYQAIFEAGLKSYAEGGQGNNPTYLCIPGGMPRIMTLGMGQAEFVITPNITYVLLTNSLPRRIYTDGRDWPADVEPAFAGYSIGRWIDTQATGRYDTLEAETRYMKGPRTFDGATGIPLHEDNQTIVKERFYLDKNDPTLLHNDITTVDHALTRPWSAQKSYRRAKAAIWIDGACSENNEHVRIGTEDYVKNGYDSLLMPARKDQPPPDLRYFKPVKR